jgi:hypothetical protein
MLLIKTVEAIVVMVKMNMNAFQPLTFLYCLVKEAMLWSIDMVINTTEELILPKHLVEFLISSIFP